MGLENAPEICPAALDTQQRGVYRLSNVSLAVVLFTALSHDRTGTEKAEALPASPEPHSEDAASRTPFLNTLSPLQPSVSWWFTRCSPGLKESEETLHLHTVTLL